MFSRCCHSIAKHGHTIIFIVAYIHYGVGKLLKVKKNCLMKVSEHSTHNNNFPNSVTNALSNTLEV